MKLPCLVDIVNRIHSEHSLNKGGKYARSTVALLRDPKHNRYVIMHISNTNRSGIRYELSNIKQVFTKFMNEGKATIRFTEPPHDMYIKCDANPLKSFLKVLKQCITGDTKNLRLERSDLPVKNINRPIKLVIHDRKEIPPSLPKNLINLRMNGLELKKFRSDILEMKKLQSLDISNNLIASIPPEFGEFFQAAFSLCKKKSMLTIVLLNIKLVHWFSCEMVTDKQFFAFIILAFEMHSGTTDLEEMCTDILYAKVTLLPLHG